MALTSKLCWRLISRRREPEVPPSTSTGTSTRMSRVLLGATGKLVQMTRCRAPALRFHLAAPARMGATPEQFERAKVQLSTLRNDQSNEVKLKIYALFKQATQGPCNTPKPGMLDFVGKAKWDAWSSLGSATPEEARQQYCDLIGSLVEAETGNSTQVTAPPTGSTKMYKTLLVTTENNITTITMNRPSRKNALTNEMYLEIIAALEQASSDESVLAVITGSGDYYCSGNDLSNFTKIPEGGMMQMAEEGRSLLRKYVKAYIDFPKPLVAVINGPAVGVAVTVLGMFDLVYASERATFHTPFSQLGQSPEGCSSYTFPKLMGSSKANEMLLFNKKLTAAQACQLGLVTEVFPDSSFQSEVWSRLRDFSKLPVNSLKLSKQLIRSVDRQRLHEVNDQEVELLKERWTSDECITAVMSFFQKKAKL